MTMEWLANAKRKANELLLKRRLVEGGKNASFVDVITTDPQTGETVSVESFFSTDVDGRGVHTNVVNRDVPEETKKRLTSLERVA